MGGPHKHDPIPFRPPAEDRVRLLALHKATGRPVNAILAEALRRYLSTVPAAGETTAASPDEAAET